MPLRAFFSFLIFVSSSTEIKPVNSPIRLMNSIREFFAQLFPSYSGEAYNINHLFLQFLILAGIIVAIVAGMVIFAAIFYNSKKHPGEPRQVFGNKKIEILWTVVPLILVSLFFVLTLRSMREINLPFTKGQKPDIVIIAHQWWWDMRYPKEKVITANELHIPVGKRLLMLVESADVIHDWWVQDLGRKIDAIPGRLNYTWIEADSARTYEGACSEYCGMQHAWMRIKVIAESQADFDKWVAHQQEIPPVPSDSVGREGARFFQEKTCANCHAIAGTPAQAHIGPDLSHIATRETILSGMLPNTRENLSKWLKDPQKVKEGAHMPDFMLSKQEINALVTYLEELK